MVAHRALQRTLFRMQLDSSFAQAVLARDVAAEGSTELSERELSWLHALDPACISADRAGARRAQFLRNVGSELAMTLRLTGMGLLDDFTRSSELHAAVCDGSPLPLALARHLERTLAASEPAARAVLELEHGMARARRELRTIQEPSGDQIVLAPWARLISVPAGTLALAEALRLRDPDSAAHTPVPRLADEAETLLITAEREPAPFQLRAVVVERLADAPAHFLQRAERPLSRGERAAYAREVDAEPEELDALVAELLHEGVLLDCTGWLHASGGATAPP